MANPDWGAKRVCLSCATKFYDFGKNPIVCPGCGNSFSPDDFSKPKRGGRGENRAEAAAAAAARARPKRVDEVEEVAADVDVELEDEADLAEEDEDDEADDTLVLSTGAVRDADVLEPEAVEAEDLQAELSGEIDPEYRKEDVG